MPRWLGAHGPENRYGELVASRGFDTSAFRMKKTGECPHCQGTILELDAGEDETLYGMFGGTLDEHYPGCPNYEGMPE